MKKIGLLLSLCVFIVPCISVTPRSVIVIPMGWSGAGVGKVVDHLAETADIVVRGQGGSAKGHRVLRRSGDGFNLVLLPSGIIRKNTQCHLAAGMEIDPELFFSEVDLLKSKNIKVEGRLWVSSRAHLIMPYHRDLDDLILKYYRGGADEGSRKGVGSAAADKRLRIGIRVADLLDPERLKVTLRDSINFANELLTKVFEVKPYQFDEIHKLCTDYARRLRPYVKHEMELEINKLILQGKGVILEGSQGVFLDLSMGSYPYVASSSTTAAGICTGAGVGPRYIGHTLGIVQSYNTLIGSGPLPAEIKDEAVLKRLKKAHSGYCEEISDMRYGWVDLVLIRQAILINGVDSLVISKLDELDSLDEIKICYDYVINGKNYDYLPACLNDARKIEPRYITIPGWKTSTRNAKSISDLPEAARTFVKKIEVLSGVPISFVSNGSERSQMIKVNDLLPL